MFNRKDLHVLKTTHDHSFSFKVEFFLRPEVTFTKITTVTIEVIIRLFVLYLHGRNPSMSFDIFEPDKKELFLSCFRQKPACSRLNKLVVSLGFGGRLLVC